MSMIDSVYLLCEIGESREFYEKSGDKSVVEFIDNLADKIVNGDCDATMYDFEMMCQHFYNKAIDDFVRKVELKYLGVHPDELYDKYYPREVVQVINEIAEQLKGGGENEQN